MACSQENVAKSDVGMTSCDDSAHAQVMGKGRQPQRALAAVWAARPSAQAQLRARSTFSQPVTDLTPCSMCARRTPCCTVCFAVTACVQQLQDTPLRTCW